MDQYEILKHYFGYDRFRPGQERLIGAILSGRDVLGIMPTGGGKSLCYQVPALMLPGITLVISPLISLMKDQVTALRKAGVDAAYLNSTLSPDQIRLVYRRAYQGAYKLLYIAPERLSGEGFSALTREVPVSLVAVDEAHCISQWGQDFRPSYLKISEFLHALPRRPVVAAFTATATAQVRDDIAQRLELENPLCEVTGFDRPNLFLDVRSPQRKLPALLELVQERRGKSGIIYCATRSGVEKVCAALCQRGIPATRYHAGLDEEERQANQDDRRPVMVATNAFGMGIDKSNVSYVIHYNMPKSLEAYYQEAGRAGRDGEPADCILLYSAGDITTAKFLLENSGNVELDEEEQEQVRRQDQARLQAMRLLPHLRLPPGPPSGLLRAGARPGLRELRQLPRGVPAPGHHRPRPDDPLLCAPGEGPAGLLRGKNAPRPGPAGQPKPAGDRSGPGPALHLRSYEAAPGGTGPDAHGLSGVGGLSSHQSAPRHAGTHPGRRQDSVSGGETLHAGAEGPGRGGAAGGPQKNSRPLPRPRGGGPVLRPPGRPDPAGAGGKRPGLCGVLQRHFGGHGGEGPPYDG